MNQVAVDAIEKAWMRTVKARALCPYTDDRMIGASAFASPSWYKERGVEFFVKPAKELTVEDISELRGIGTFINRSFVITICAILEETGVCKYLTDPDSSKQGGEHVQLAKWLRNRFAHGEWEYDDTDGRHVETLQLQRKLFPVTSAVDEFATSIDKVLEPLKAGVIEYIKATT
ncbi:hypothetical protein ACFLS0_00610 [Candidatus Bipolaricaulota bacterium]